MDECIFCGKKAEYVCVGCGLLVCKECKEDKGFGSMHKFEKM